MKPTVTAQNLAALPPAAARQRAFTLVELLVVIAVGAILAMVAIPSLRTTMQNNRLDTVSNQFAAMLSMARSEAVKLGQSVTVQSANAGNGTDWTQGWKVISPVGLNGGIVQQGGVLASPMTATGSVGSLAFDSTGRLSIPNGTSANFIFCVDGADPTKARGVTVAASGRVRVADMDKATGVPVENDQATLMQSCAVVP